MKTNQYDIAMNGILERIDKVSERLAIQFKGIKPFAKEVIPKSEMLRSYNSLTPDDMNWLIATHGQDKMNQFIFEMESDKQKHIEKLERGWYNA